jgi:hypothetical protein
MGEMVGDEYRMETITPMGKRVVQGFVVECGVIEATGNRVVFRYAEPAFLVERPLLREAINRADALLAFYRENHPTK